MLPSENHSIQSEVERQQMDELTNENDERTQWNRAKESAM